MLYRPLPPATKPSRSTGRLNIEGLERILRAVQAVMRENELRIPAHKRDSFAVSGSFIGH